MKSKTYMEQMSDPLSEENSSDVFKLNFFLYS